MRSMLAKCRNLASKSVSAELGYERKKTLDFGRGSAMRPNSLRTALIAMSFGAV